MQTKYSTGVVLCIIATMSWGGMFPVMGHAMQYVDPFTFTCMRYALAGLAFLALLVVREGQSSLRLRGERVALAWFFGTAGFAGFQFLVFLGQDLAGTTGALIASIMMATQPLLGFLVNWVVRKALPPVGAFGFIAMSFVGVVMVITKGHVANLIQRPQDYAAAGMIVLGALCWVTYTVGAAFFPGWSAVKYTTVTTGLGLGSAWVITGGLLGAGFINLPTVSEVGSVIPDLAYMGFIAGFTGVLCWNYGNRILTPLNGVLFMDVVPVTTFAILAITGHVPAVMQIVGAVITASALVMNNLYLRHRMTSPKTPPAPVATAVIAGERKSHATARAR